MKINISDITLYQRCPRAYQLKRDGAEARKGLSWLKGVVVRHFVRRFHESGESQPGEIGLVWLEYAPQIDATEANKKETRTETKGERALADVVEWIGNYEKLNLGVAARHPKEAITTTILDSEISFTVDQIRGDDQIVFLKANNGVPDKAFMGRDFEVSVAAYAWKKKTGRIPQLAYYYFPNLGEYKRKTKLAAVGDLKGDPMIPITRSEKTLAEFEYEVSLVIAGIEMQYFPMMASSMGCQLCSYQSACQSASEPINYNEPNGSEIME